VREHPSDVLPESAAGSGPEQDGAGDQRLAGLVSVELDWLRQADVLGDEPANGVVDDLAVTVRHMDSLPVRAGFRLRGSP
jgi:hypothetical protein